MARPPRALKPNPGPAVGPRGVRCAASALAGPALAATAVPRRAPGRFIVLAASVPSCRDVVMSALRRRLSGRQQIHFPTLVIAGNRLEMMGEGLLGFTRRQFQAMEAEGAFALTWSEHGARMALPLAAVAQLEGGLTLVVPGPQSLALDLRRWTEQVDVVTLAPELDQTRTALAPKACLSRMVAPAIRPRLSSLQASRRPAVAIALHGQLGRSIEQLTSAIIAISA